MVFFVIRQSRAVMMARGIFRDIIACTGSAMPIEYIPPRDSISIEDLGSSLKIVIPNRFDTGYLLYFIYLMLGLFPIWFVIHLWFLFRR